MSHWHVRLGAQKTTHVVTKRPSIGRNVKIQIPDDSLEYILVNVAVIRIT